MRKLRIAILMGVVCAGSMVHGQSLSLSNGSNDVSNDTVYLVGTADTALIESKVKVKNETDKEIEVKARKIEISVVPESENSFCWGACYPPFIFEASQPITIPANGIDHNSFVGDYAPNEKVGTTVIKYTFYVAANPDDSVSFVVKYQIGAAGVLDWTLDPGVVNVYPNPAKDQVRIHFPAGLREETEIQLISITGQTLHQETLIPGQLFAALDLTKVNKGLYFIGILNQKGDKIYKRLIIN